MKGIVLAGGIGSRFYPITKGVSKQLLPVYDKPMIYYPLSLLMLAEIKEVLIITKREDYQSFFRLFGNGSKLGINIEYAIQKKPEGLAQAFIIGEEFIQNQNVALVLGDNLFYGYGLPNTLKKAIKKKSGASIFGYSVKNPEKFGVVEFDKNQNVISIEEKPITPKSNYAVTGLYFYDNKVVEYAKKVKPSHRGELEITSLNEIYLRKKSLTVNLLGRGFSWLDMGTHESLLEASNFVETIQKSQGFKIACLEEISWRNKWITDNDMKNISKNFPNEYGNYIETLINKR